MTANHQIRALTPSAGPDRIEQVPTDDPVRLLAAAILELARADWPYDSEKAAKYLKCKVDTLRRIPVQQLPRQRAGKEATYLKHDLLQYLVTYRRDQPKPENPLASPRRHRPSLDSDGGRGRDSLKGNAS